MFKVTGYHPDFKSDGGDEGEPVAILSDGTCVALDNCELTDFVAVQPAFPY